MGFVADVPVLERINAGLEEGIYFAPEARKLVVDGPVEFRSMNDREKFACKFAAVLLSGGSGWCLHVATVRLGWLSGSAAVICVIGAVLALARLIPD